MKIPACGWWWPALALVLVLADCAPGERGAQRADEAAPAAETAIADEGGVAAEEEAAAAEPEAGQPEAGGEALGDSTPQAAAESPEAIAPAAEGEARAMRNWVLLEFARPVEEADLEWLKANGFQVDSVMGELLVRGWLEGSEGAGVIARDPRIARIHTQMR